MNLEMHEYTYIPLYIDRSPPVVNSINDYLVGTIISYHLEITHSFFTPQTNSIMLILGPTILPHINIFFSFSYTL